LFRCRKACWADLQESNNGWERKLSALNSRMHAQTPLSFYFLLHKRCVAMFKFQIQHIFNRLHVYLISKAKREQYVREKATKPVVMHYSKCNKERVSGVREKKELHPIHCLISWTGEWTLRLGHFYLKSCIPIWSSYFA